MGSEKNLSMGGGGREGKWACNRLENCAVFCQQVVNREAI